MTAATLSSAADSMASSDSERWDLILELLMRYPPAQERSSYRVDDATKTRLGRTVSIQNRQFKSRTGMAFGTWKSQVLEPLTSYVDLLVAKGDVRVKRAHQLGLDQRLFRAMNYFRGEKIISSSAETDQALSTVYKDLHLMVDLVKSALMRKWMSPFDPQSAEYTAMRGFGTFEMFPNVVYAADGIIIGGPVPSGCKQSWYYNKNKKKTGFLMITGCSGSGETRFIVGPFPARASESVLLRYSGFEDNIRKVVREGDQILYDCAFGYGPRARQGTMICPTFGPGGSASTTQEEIYNDRVRTARCLIENTYARLTNRFPIFKYFRLDVTRLYCMMVVAFIFINIDCRFDASFR